MKYTEKYPVKALTAGYQENYVNPAKLVAIDLMYSDRWFPCFICMDKTPYVDESGQNPVHVCSDECSLILNERMIEFPDPKTTPPSPYGVRDLSIRAVTEEDMDRLLATKAVDVID